MKPSQIHHALKGEKSPYPAPGIAPPALTMLLSSLLSWCLSPAVNEPHSSFFPQLERKALRTKAVRPLSLPSSEVHVKAGDVCSVAGWGKMAPDGKFPNGLQEVKLTVQKDQECESRFQGYYNKTIEICEGDPKITRASFKVS